MIILYPFDRSSKFLCREKDSERPRVDTKKFIKSNPGEIIVT